MSAPATSVAMQLGTRLREMHGVIEQLRAAELTAIEARHEANVREWKHFMSTPGGAELRKTAARLEVEAFTFAAENAEAEVRHLIRALREADKRVEVGRTFAADARVEAKTLGLTPETWT